MEKLLQVFRIRLPKCLLFAVLWLISNTAPAPGLQVAFILVPEHVDAYERLVQAIIQVESSGNPMAFNLIENAAGAFQIRPIRLMDYYQRTGKNYKLNDCYNIDISKEIFLYYAISYGFIDYESIARNWNGSGKSTLDYWAKVKNCLML